MPVRIIPSSQIDQVQWDRFIRDQPCGPVYAHYEHLNSFCDHWSALVVGNFTAVLPLPWRKKFGIRYYYQPAFTQQLGIIGNVTTEEWPAIIRAIKQFAAFGELNFNHGNTAIVSFLPAIEMTNLILPLQESIITIRNNYKPSLAKSLHKANQQPLEYHTTTSPTSAIALYQQLYGSRMLHINATSYQQLDSYCRSLAAKGECFVRYITLQGQSTILATMLLLSNGKRLYNLCNAITEQGRELAANHWLFDHVLQEFSGNDLVFDFEGSSLPGVRSFYELFGAKDEPYFRYIRNNQVHALQRLLK